MRFYVPLPLADGQELPLPDDVAHHLVRVLRADTGTRLALFNGEGGVWEAELVEVGKKLAVARLLAHTAESRQSPLATHLGQVMSKGDRMDYAIQKATELGVTDITPLTSERCELRLRGEERADKKLDHWRRVAISACEQCGRNIPPRIHEPQTLSEWSAQVKADLRLVLAPAIEGALPDAPVQSVALLIGPEGGLSDTEIAAVREQGFRPWQLGPRVLRTETAPVAALTLLQARFGDL